MKQFDKICQLKPLVLENTKEFHQSVGNLLMREIRLTGTSDEKRSPAPSNLLVQIM
jgi:hypothetical protein